MKQAEDTNLFNRRTIVFVDEIHRFNKSQQDYLLPFVENGIITTDEFVEQSARYLKSLGTSVRVGGHKYKYFDVHSLIDDLEKYIHPRNTFTYSEGGLRPHTI